MFKKKPVESVDPRKECIQCGEMFLPSYPGHDFCNMLCSVAFREAEEKYAKR